VVVAAGCDRHQWTDRAGGLAHRLVAPWLRHARQRSVAGPGAVLGKAMGSMAKGEGLVLILVVLQ